MEKCCCANIFNVQNVYDSHYKRCLHAKHTPVNMQHTSAHTACRQILCVSWGYSRYSKVSCYWSMKTAACSVWMHRVSMKKLQNQPGLIQHLWDIWYSEARAYHPVSVLWMDKQRMAGQITLSRTKRHYMTA